MDNIYFNQCILCDVLSCKYQKLNNCTLSAIKVSNQNNQTICKNYKKKN